LVLDEVQKIPNWSELVKKLFDEDRRVRRGLRVLLLGSSALLMQKGLTESLAGRFELHRHFHWSFAECREYFKVNLSEYLYFGGYPGAMPMRRNQERWARYVRDSLIETVLAKDVLLLMPVTKPALLRQLFGLATAHPAEILSYQKMLGQLQDAGNTTTVASYLNLLANAFLVAPLERWSGSRIKQRGSIPKLLVLDNALVSATSGQSYKQLKSDRSLWGRLIENAVGARLYLILQNKGANLLYWRQRQEEVDFVFQLGGEVYAVEVKSSAKKTAANALLSFGRRYKKAKLLLLSPVKEKKCPGISSVALADYFNDPRIIFRRPGRDNTGD
jgi:predicted AAA+ superfamily ATPase